MSSFKAQHPASEWLLALLDGELPAGRADQVRRHVEACWQCRAEMEGLQRTVADCVRYRDKVLAEHLPPPPAPWADLSRGFARIDAERQGGWWRRLMAPAPLRWAAAVAALVVTAGIVVQQFRQTPSVEAAALLNRAVAAASSSAMQPQKARRIQVRTRTQQFTRTVGNRDGAAIAEAAARPAVAVLFQTAHYDWSDPLSAESYREWRDGLPEKHDQVTEVAEGYRIHTVAAGGVLESASLTLRETDLRPVQGRFEFRNEEWVELTELEASAGDDPISAAHNVEPPLRRVVPSQPAATASGSSASVTEELQVLAALHGIGADLGDPVEIVRSGGNVLVSGVGVPSARQGEIQRAVGGIPNVVVQFTEPRMTAPPAEPPAVPGAVAEPRPSPLQVRLEQQLGGRAHFERFSSQMLDWSEAAMARVYALRSLAQRFPAETVSAMTARERQTLSDLARAHAEVLEKRAAGLERELAPVLARLGGRPQGRAAVEAGSWQRSAEELFRISRRVEMLLSSLVGAVQAEGGAERVPGDLLNALGDLRAQAERCGAMAGAR